MNQQPSNKTRTIKYSYNIHTGKTIRVNTQRKAGVGPGVAADVFEVTDIPADVTDQKVLELYNIFLNDWFQNIGIYSYPYSLIKEATTPVNGRMLFPFPTVKQHVEVIMDYKHKKVTEVIEYLAQMMDKGVSTMWRIYKENKAERDTLLALNFLTHDILERRLWTVD